MKKELPIGQNKTQTILPLTDLLSGQKALVRKLDGGQSFISRMAALGFTPGATLSIVRKNSSHHGPLLVKLRGAQVALGFGEAESVQVSLLQSETPAENLTDVPVSKKALIALAGQPNVGKSTIFNMLTGLNQHVGNWTGKTVDLKTGIFQINKTAYELVDLPGTYSLTASSEEERIARNFILQEKPDLVIAVVDAATLERNLYLVAELLLLATPIILVLNMMDVAKQEGIKIEPEVLQTALGIPVIPMAASHGQGTNELFQAIQNAIEQKSAYKPHAPSILPTHEDILQKIKLLLNGKTPPSYPLDWCALKLLEGDEEISHILHETLPGEDWEKIQRVLYQHEDAILDIAGARYEWIARMIRVAVVEPQVTKVGFTTRLDRVLTHPFYGSLALIGILGLVFGLTYSIGSPIQRWLSEQVTFLSTLLHSGLGAWPVWLVEFITGGLLGGVGMVLTFLPILVIFYAILGIMEDTGYLARAAYLTDRLMHSMGLHGKSFLPILLGFGCNVPAILGTRIIESRRARILTILLIPLIPCTARMAVVTILAPLFFGSAAVWVAWGLVGGNLLLLALAGLFLHHSFFGNEHVPFVMELPLYHIPNLKTIGIYIWRNIIEFIQKAGTIILIGSVVIWVLSYFPGAGIQNSYLGWVGQKLEPVGRLMGLPWPVFLALLTSFVAKENTIATLSVLYGNITQTLPALLTPASALAFLVFQMLFIPCVATIAGIRQETRSIKWTLLSMTLMIVLSFGLSILVYQIGRLF